MLQPIYEELQMIFLGYTRSASENSAADAMEMNLDEARAHARCTCRPPPRARCTCRPLTPRARSSVRAGPLTRCVVVRGGGRVLRLLPVHRLCARLRD
eukprot:1535627-Prymnesium_polylepis.1